MLVLAGTAALVIGGAAAPSTAARFARISRLAHPTAAFTWLLARDERGMRPQAARDAQLDSPFDAFAGGARAARGSTSVEPWAGPSVPVGANPSGIAVNPANDTVYVVNQVDDSVSVIDAQACRAGHPPGCVQRVATISLGPGELANGPLSAVVSPDGRTLYVTMPGGANAVAVIDVSHCNANQTSGCGAGSFATVATGNGPLDLTEDPSTQTLYVTNIGDDTVSVIDAGHCNAQDTSDCGETAPTVPVGTAPVGAAFDPATDTVYVANVGDDTVSVIDAGACNASHPAGCAAIPPVQAVGGAPDAVAVSPGGGTVYVANSGNGLSGFVAGGSTVSLVDAVSCSGRHPQGCSTTTSAAVVGVGGGEDDQPQSLAVDAQTHSVYVANANDDSVSVIDGRRCTARNPAMCPAVAPALQAGGEPNAVAVLPQRHTVYAVDGTDSAVSVIDTRACTASHGVGCRPAAVLSTAVDRYSGLLAEALDAADHTAYLIDYGIGSGGPFVLDTIDTNTCRSGDTLGCVVPASSIQPASTPDSMTVDTTTDTLYVSEGGPGPNQLEVFDAAHCNASDTRACASTSVIPLGADDSEGGVAIDPATHSAYVGGSSAIAVIDTLHCNAGDTRGCAAQPVAEIPTGQATAHLVVAADTLYAEIQPNYDLSATGFVDVFSTLHCQAADISQCGIQSPPQVAVGTGPVAPSLDAAHHTLYIPDNANGDSAGLLSMLDTTHCNGDDSSACLTQKLPTARLGRAPLASLLDPATNTLYVTNFSDASVFAFNTNQCNAITQAGCPTRPPQVIVGSGPDGLALDPAAHTLYVPNFFDGTVSLVPTQH